MIVKQKLEKIDDAQKYSIFSPQNLGWGGGGEPIVPESMSGEATYSKIS